MRAEGAIGGLRAEVATRLTVRRTGPRPGAGRPLAQAPGGQVTAVRGRLPDGWRWVTELDPEPARSTPEQRTRLPRCPQPEPRRSPPATALPLTSAALQAAARTKQRPGGLPGTARRPPVAVTAGAAADNEGLGFMAVQESLWDASR